jgi:hypothetical protein
MMRAWQTDVAEVGGLFNDAVSSVGWDEAWTAKDVTGNGRDVFIGLEEMCKRSNSGSEML